MSIQEETTLEALIDKHGIADVLYAVQGICEGKAAHVEAEWQDPAQAKLWERAALRVGNAGAAVETILGDLA